MTVADEIEMVMHVSRRANLMATRAFICFWPRSICSRIGGWGLPVNRGRKPSSIPHRRIPSGARRRAAHVCVDRVLWTPGGELLSMSPDAGL
jgi:hypothetical protein